VEAEVAEQLAQQAQVVPTVHEGIARYDVNLETALTNVYAQASPAVVYIIVGNSSGSGFVYDSEGHIITNNHVVASGGTYEVVFANSERTFAHLVGSDVDSDLAVLQVESLPEGIAPLPLATETVQVGQFVVAIGNPFGEQGSMSLGIVSGLGRSLPSQRSALGGSTYSLPQVIQTDAPINPGNSGGPLLNLEGEVVGVNAAIATTSGSNSGVGFSIPVAAIQRVVPTLIAEGTYTYPYMGVAFDGEITLEEKEGYGIPQTQGAYVISITPDGPGDTAGLIAANPNTGRGGDLIIALDDRAIQNFADLNSYLSFHTAVGQTLQVTVLRNGETLTLPLTLGARP
jgi:2-alkenal reductase